MTFSYSEIVPDQAQDKVMAWALEIEKYEWKIGRLAVDLADEWDGKITRSEVCAALAYFANRETGTEGKLEPGTIMDYEYTARNVPPSIVGEWDHLGRHHFRALIPLCHNESQFIEILTAWENDPHTLTQSVRSLRAYLNPPREDPEWLKTLQNARSGVKKLLSDTEIPSPYKSAAQAFLAGTNGKVKSSAQDKKPQALPDPLDTARPVGF